MKDDANERSCGILKYVDATKLLQLKFVAISNNRIESIEGLSRIPFQVESIDISSPFITQAPTTSGPSKSSTKSICPNSKALLPVASYL